MDETRLSRLLRDIQARVDRRMPEDEAVERHGEETVAEAADLALVDIDDGTFWQVEPALSLTRAGRARLKDGRAGPLGRTPARAVEWLRATFTGPRPKRP